MCSCTTKYRCQLQFQEYKHKIHSKLVLMMCEDFVKIPLLWVCWIDWVVMLIRYSLTGVTWPKGDQPVTAVHQQFLTAMSKFWRRTTRSLWSSELKCSRTSVWVAVVLILGFSSWIWLFAQSLVGFCVHNTVPMHTWVNACVHSVPAVQQLHQWQLWGCNKTFLMQSVHWHLAVKLYEHARQCAKDYSVQV